MERIFFSGGYDKKSPRADPSGRARETRADAKEARRRGAVRSRTVRGGAFPAEGRAIALEDEGDGAGVPSRTTRPCRPFRRERGRGTGPGRRPARGRPRGAAPTPPPRGRRVGMPRSPSFDSAREGSGSAASARAVEWPRANGRFRGRRERRHDGTSSVPHSTRGCRASGHHRPPCSGKFKLEKKTRDPPIPRAHTRAPRHRAVVARPRSSLVLGRLQSSSVGLRCRLPRWSGPSATSRASAMSPTSGPATGRAC